MVEYRGTRNKKVYLNPKNGLSYFFKESYRQGKKDYKFEFWSEIIAYEVGTSLGFDVLPYHIAKRGETLGCISKSMIGPEEQLTEGGKYLQAFNPLFRPENTQERSRYDFQLIVESLEWFGLEKYIPKLIEVIVFYALIGNSDRHQENWAVLTRPMVLPQTINQIEKEGLGNSVLGRFAKRIFGKEKSPNDDLGGIRLFLERDTSFAPIYDSGCCFGRELNDEKVSQILSNQDQLNAYIERGRAEIHWRREKISHFQLLENLLSTQKFKEFTFLSLNKVVENFKTSQIKQTIFDIDKVMELSGLGRHLPRERKELIWELLALRHQRIRDIYLNHK
ncbi:hypothetical protein [Algoriphagus sp.]|uniref:hypothetical protein n=1 Tax=Algoriphagus sp. TaxID=1872435 RepID=UPI003F715BE0